MGDKLQVSNSRINTFRRCQRAHYYKYVMKLRPKKKGSALVRGSVLHECIEAYNTGRSWKRIYEKFKKQWDETYFEEEKVELGDIPKMVYTLMENYVACYGEDEGLDYIENELEFNLDLTPDINIIGYIDAVIEEDEKYIWCGETKTHAQIPGYDVRIFNMQSALYCWALNEMGFDNIRGVLWNYIKAKQPTEPMLLKSGKLSTKKLDSTPLVVEKAIKAYGLDIRNYQGLINAQSYENYFKRYKVPVSKDIVKSVLEDTIETSKIILHHPDLKARNLNKDCSWCNYKILCQADILNQDTDFLIRTEFEVSDEGRNENGKGKKEKGCKIKKRKKDRNRK